MHFSEPAHFAIKQSVTCFIIAFSGVALALPRYIEWLKQNQIRQYLREEGPATHAHKAQTPTTGGVCFLIITVIAFEVCDIFYFHALANECLAVLALAAACGFIGLLDDLAKVRRRANQGLSAPLRLGLELMLGAAFGLVALCWMTYQPAFGLILSPILKDLTFGLAIGNPVALDWNPLLFVLFSSFLVAATTNSVNLHDGMDGLAAGTVTIVLFTLAKMLFGTGQLPLALLAMASAGALSGFLIYNRRPAKIFMGDTGSLFLGGLLAGLSLAGGLSFWFVPLSMIYIAETISVFSQVIYFKLTKPYQPVKPMSQLSIIWLKLTKRLPGEGKRLLRMAPLHHHFEALLTSRGVDQGQAESLVVGGFWLAQALICLTTLAAFNL